MTVQEDLRVVEHEIGERGRVTVRLPEATVRLRAVDGPTVRGRVSGYDVEESVRIQSVGPEFRIDAVDRWHGLGKGLLGAGTHGSYDVELDVPRGAALTIDLASGDVRAEGFQGEQRHRVTAGEIVLVDAGGTAVLEGVSADLKVDAASDLELRARTVSGDIRVGAALLSRLETATTSGQINISGQLAAGVGHEASTLSGDIVLAVVGGLRVQTSTMTGDVRAEVEHRSEGRSGKRVLVVGDGAAEIVCKSMSGRIRVVGPAGQGASEAASEQHAEAAAAEPDDELDDEPDRLAILLELERGEIDVTEASRRLGLVESER